MSNNSPEDLIEFIKKLSSEDSGLEKQIAIEAIETQLRNFEQSPFFPEIFTILENVNIDSKTRTLPDYSREIITNAVEAYCKS